MKYAYPAIVYPDGDQVGVKVPDLPGCVAFGADTAEALLMAKDAAEMWLWDSENSNEAIPPASASLPLEPGETFTIIAADTDEYRKARESRELEDTPGKSSTKSVISAIVGAICIIWSLADIILGISGNIAFNRYKETALVGSALITDIQVFRRHGGYGGARYKVYLDYEIDGTKYKTVVPHYRSYMDEGDGIKYYYEPQSPGYIRIDAEAFGLRDFLNSALFCLLGILCFLIPNWTKS